MEESTLMTLSPMPTKSRNMRSRSPKVQRTKSPISTRSPRRGRNRTESWSSTNRAASRSNSPVTPRRTVSSNRLSRDHLTAIDLTSPVPNNSNSGTPTNNNNINSLTASPNSLKARLSKFNKFKGGKRRMSATEMRYAGLFLFGLMFFMVIVINRRHQGLFPELDRYTRHRLMVEDQMDRPTQQKEWHYFYNQTSKLYFEKRSNKKLNQTDIKKQQQQLRSSSSTKSFNASQFLEDNKLKAQKNRKTFKVGKLVVAESVAHVAGTKVRFRYPQQRFEAPTDMLFGVFSMPEKGSLRQTIRDTWGRNHPSLFFIVGGEWTKELQRELQDYEDIVWMDRAEVYRHLMVKTFVFFWAVRHHANYNYALKVDDDVYPNLYQWTKYISSDESQPPDYVGMCHSNKTVERDPEHRWYVSEETFPDPVWSTYANGPSYALSSKFVDSECFGENLKSIPFLPLEDVAIGMIANACNKPCNEPDNFELSFQDMHDPKLNTTYSIMDIKIPDIFKRLHIDYCLDPIYKKFDACQGYNVTCATDPDNLKSWTCRDNSFTHCGGVYVNENCGKCPENPWNEWVIQPDWCGGDCHWCPDGVEGDGLEFTALAEELTLTERCVDWHTKCRDLTEQRKKYNITHVVQQPQQQEEEPKEQKQE